MNWLKLKLWLEMLALRYYCWRLTRRLERDDRRRAKRLVRQIMNATRKGKR
ncbi:MAG: hypothetical protein KGL39_35360 [Patescibacteria group bacterium]|nr:hypothetical protein [Patescibacteria group bacterium]